MTNMKFKDVYGHIADIYDSHINDKLEKAIEKHGKSVLENDLSEHLGLEPNWPKLPENDFFKKRLSINKNTKQGLQFNRISLDENLVKIIGEFIEVFGSAKTVVVLDVIFSQQVNDSVELRYHGTEHYEPAINTIHFSFLKESILYYMGKEPMLRLKVMPGGMVLVKAPF